MKRTPPGALTALVLFACAAFGAEVQHVQVVVDVPQAAGLFPSVQSGSAGFPAFSRAEVPAELALPQGIFVHTDMQNGLYSLAQGRPQAPAAGTSVLGVNAVLGGANPAVLNSGNPLVQAREKSAAESARLSEQSATFAALLDNEGKRFDGSRSVVRGRDDPSEPASLRGSNTAALDRNSVAPFSRALNRYGLTPDTVRELVAVYEKSHPAANERPYHNRLLGIRAANLMAQYLAGNEKFSAFNAPGESFSQTFYEEQTTKNPRIKVALILAALFHRTARSTKAPPTARDVEQFFVSDSEVNRWMHSFERGQSPKMDDMVKALIAYTDYTNTNYHEQDRKEETLRKLFGNSYPGSPAEQRNFGLKLAGILQLVTRSAMFTDSFALAQASVRARAEEARAAAKEGQHGPNGDEAVVAAAAEISDLISGRMPAMPRGYISFPHDSSPANNLISNYHAYRAAAAELINGRDVRSTLAPEKR